jgi:hypothetical protein
MNIPQKLQVKYGLDHLPSEFEVNSWHISYLLSKIQGADNELAGHQAASRTFDDYQKVKYASVADTIDALLSEIKDKDDGKK